MRWPTKDFTFPRPETEASWRYKSLGSSGQLRLPLLSKDFRLTGFPWVKEPSREKATSSWLPPLKHWKTQFLSLVGDGRSFWQCVLALSMVNLAKLCLGFPEFPSLYGSSLQLTTREFGIGLRRWTWSSLHYTGKGAKGCKLLCGLHLLPLL